MDEAAGAPGGQVGDVVKPRAGEPVGGANVASTPPVSAMSQNAPTRRAPMPLRVVGAFYLAAAAVGGVAGAAEAVRAVRAGGLEFALPLGAGMSGWAIGRGLLRGSRRAWRWAQGVAAFACAFTGLLMLIATNADRARLSLPWGTRALEPGDPVVLYAGVGFVALFLAQILALRSRPARRFVESVEDRREDTPSGEASG